MRRVREKMKISQFGKFSMALTIIAALVSVVTGLLKKDVILVGFGVASLLFSACSFIELTTTPAVKAQGAK
jgi:phosphatidylglycerophosphate synthase